MTFGGRAVADRQGVSSDRRLRHFVSAYPDGDLDWAGTDQPEVLFLADTHRVTSLLAATQQAAPGLDAVTRRHLQLVQVRRQFAERRMRGDLALAAAALGSAGARWALLKGPTVTDAVYAHRARESSDLDVLVHGHDLAEVVCQLESRGATWVDADLRLLERMGSGEISLRMPGGTMLDLHWQLVHEARVRDAFAIDVDALLDRATTGPDPAYRALDETDRLLHLCLHGCLSGAERLLWSKDITLFLAHDGWDRPEFVRRARQARIELPVALMLQRAARTLSTPLPAGLLAELVGRSPWLWLLGLAERLSPGIALDRRRLLLRRVYRCTRDSAAHTLRALARELVYASVLRRIPDPAKPWQHQSPTAALAADEQRASYFAYVREIA